MKLHSTRLHAPVLRQRLLAEVHSQGKPTAFEKMAVSLAKTGRETEELKDQSLPALFELLVGNDSADLFLDDTLDRLFSPATAVLGVGADVRFSSFRDLPVSEIEVPPNGEELLSTGRFPTQARTIRRSVLFNPLAGTIEEDAGIGVDELPENPDRALPESLATASWPEEDAEAFARETMLRPGDALSGVSRDGEGTVGWWSFSANLELEGGNLKATSPHPGAAEYLNGLPPDAFRRLMLSGFGFLGTPGPVRQLDGVADADLFPAGTPAPAPDSWLWLHPEGEAFSQAPKGVRLEVVWPAEPRAGSDRDPFTAGTGGTPDRLLLPSSPYPDAAASGDLRAFCHAVSARVFFARTPLEIPVGLREHLSGEASAATAEGLVAVLLGSGHPRAFAHAVALAAEADMADTAKLRERAESLDPAQRRLVESLCGLWGAAAMAEAVLPKSDPAPETAQGRASGRPAVSYSFERDSALSCLEFFRGEPPAASCEFVLTNRIVAAIGKNARAQFRSPEERQRARDAFDAIRSCGFVTFAGSGVREGTKASETILAELLRVAAERPCGQRVLVTDNESIARSAETRGIHPMSLAVFSRRVKENILSNPIEEN